MLPIQHFSVKKKHMTVLYISSFCCQKSSNSIRKSFYHLFLIRSTLHLPVFTRIGHISQFDQCCRNLAPVVAAHSIIFPDIFAAASGRLYIRIQNGFGKCIAFFNHFTSYKTIATADADSQCTIRTGKINSICMNPEICISFCLICFLGTLCTADCSLIVFASQDYFTSLFFSALSGVFLPPAK